MSNLTLLGNPFPVLRKRLDFGEFHPELAGNYVSVWLNLSDDFQEQVRGHQERWAKFAEDQQLFAAEAAELTEAEREASEAYAAKEAELALRAEEMQDSTADIYSRLWDCTGEEYSQLVVIDPSLTAWLYSRTWDMIAEYRSGRAKVRSG